MEHVADYMLEPPADRIYCFCAHCGGEIYEGESVYDIEHDLIHNYCLGDYFEDNKRIVERV